MPRYVYKCQVCEIVFQKIHSIKEKLVDCCECNSDNSLRRIPSMPVVIKTTETDTKRQVGSLVKEYIEDVKEDLKEEKKKLSNQVYEND